MIFIVSQPRSGSTLLQNLLSNNNAVNTVSEPWILLNFIQVLRPDLMESKFDSHIAVDAFTEYLKKFNQEPVHEVIAALIKKIYEPLRQEETKYIIDKTPRYYEIISEIRSLFPQSKIILLKRNPINVARSMISTWNIKSMTKLARHHRDLLIAPRLLHEYAQEHSNDPNLLVLKYEDLVTDTENVVEKLYARLNLPFDQSVLDLGRNEKFKGKYGDPNLNKNQSSEIKEKQEKKMSPKFEDFLRGYANYLGKEFLNEFGAYSYDKTGNSKYFNYFMQIGEHQNFRGKYGMKRELKLKWYRFQCGE